jgi:copper chaperone CopZ
MPVQFRLLAPKLKTNSMNILDFRKENQTFAKPVIWAILTILSLLLIGQTVIGQTKVKFIAAGVTCSMCSNAIHKSLKSDRGIKTIKPIYWPINMHNLQTQEWIVEYKNGQYNSEETIKGLEKRVKDAGFSIQRLWVNDKLVIDRGKRRKKA